MVSSFDSGFMTCGIALAGCIVPCLRVELTIGPPEKSFHFVPLPWGSVGNEGGLLFSLALSESGTGITGLGEAFRRSGDWLLKSGSVFGGHRSCIASSSSIGEICGLCV